jgi:hypothetical protein
MNDKSAGNDKSGSILLEELYNRESEIVEFGIGNLERVAKQVGYKVISNAEIAEGFKEWTNGHNLWRVIRNCPSLGLGSEEGRETGMGQCCDHLNCEMQTQSECGKCGYEVMASYQFLLGHLGM